MTLWLKIETKMKGGRERSINQQAAQEAYWAVEQLAPLLIWNEKKPFERSNVAGGDQISASLESMSTTTTSSITSANYQVDRMNASFQSIAIADLHRVAPDPLDRCSAN